MKKIIILTTRYPYGDKETFLDPEVCIARDIFQVDLVPTNSEISKLSIRDIPTDIKLQNIFCGVEKLLEKLWYTVLAFIQKSTWSEIHSLAERKMFCLNYLYRTLRFISRGERIFKKLEKQYKYELTYNKDELIFYSYWMLESAYAVARLKQKYKVKAITRAHRVDLYEDFQSASITLLPMRKYIMSVVDCIYSISEDGKRYMSTKFGFEDKIRVSYLGTHDNGVHKTQIERKPFVIASCARMVQVKRLELLIEALSEIKEFEVQWIHFGDGSERTKLVTLINKLPENIEVILMGDIEHSEVMSYYEDKDVHLFVNTSSSEGVPVSIMEAISYGIPCIATDVGGTREVVITNVSGKCVPDDITPNQLYQSILDIANMDTVSYSYLRKNTREFWEEKFDAEANYVSFYNELL